MIKRIIVNTNKLLVFIFLGVLLFFSSCASKKNVLYFQDIGSLSNKEARNPKVVIQKNDLLSIIVSSPNPEIAEPYNLPAISIVTTTNTIAPNRTQAYLVDNNGEIEIPVLGKIKVAGLTKEEAKEKVVGMLKKAINDPIVNFRIINFSVTVLGDVRTPGTFNISNEEINVLEAIGLAGDMTITGSRKDVLVIRENSNGKKEYATLDFTKSDLFESEYYYLQQNDIVVVNPNYAQVQRSIANPNTGIFVSIASLLISILVIFTR